MRLAVVGGAQNQRGYKLQEAMAVLPGPPQRAVTGAGAQDMTVGLGDRLARLIGVAGRFASLSGRGARWSYAYC